LDYVGNNLTLSGFRAVMNAGGKVSFVASCARFATFFNVWLLLYENLIIFIHLKIG